MKKIIILTQKPGTGLGDTRYDVVFWFPITATKRVVDNTRISAYKNIIQSELDALRDGSVLEELFEIQIPSGTTQAQVKSILESRYLSREIAINNLPDPNKFYGVNWDGTTWANS